MSWRLFAALPVPPEMQDRLSAVRAGVPFVRWIDGERMHITLRFIGDVERRTAEDIDAALSDIAAPAFRVTVRGLGQFEKGGRAHTLYARIEPDPALTHLHGKVESAVVRAGAPAGRRKFKPHITLARRRAADDARMAAALQAAGDFAPGAFDAEAFVLYRSHLGAEKPVYEPLAEYPLNAVYAGPDAEAF
ncbi:MAG: RNA 2',3'-cyclic phosphodiesterase [Rhodospirillales bacterium]